MLVIVTPSPLKSVGEGVMFLVWQTLLPRYLMNYLNNGDKTYRKQPSGPADDLVRFWMSRSQQVVEVVKIFTSMLWHQSPSSGWNCCRLQNIQVIFLLLGIAMGLFAIVLLLFGFASTGLTRENICEGTKCVRGGISCAVLVSSCHNSSSCNLYVD